MRFDWYTATVKGVPAYTLQDAVSSLGEGLWEPVKREGKARQYQHAVEFVNHTTERTEGWMRWGGNGGGVLLDFSGEAADPVARFLREFHPGCHSPSRLDLAVDLRGPTLFDELHAQGVHLAGKTHPRTKVRQDGDWTWLEDGRTLYFGSSQSACQLVVYEKGLQLLGKGIEAPRDMVRLELRVRGDRELRRFLPRMEPEAMWGLSELPRNMLEFATGRAVEKVRVLEFPTADEARFEAFADQWGAHVQRWVDRDGADVFFRLLKAARARRKVA